MNATVVAAIIAASVSVLTLIGTLAAQFFGRRATSRQLDRTLVEQRAQLDKTLDEQRTRTRNERFATAAGQLGGDKPPAVRLAGVYAMAVLADDWPENRQTCVDVLCAYLRMPYERDPGEEAREKGRVNFRADREVRHTAIRVITAHLKYGAAASWQGLDFDFTGVVFDGGNFGDAEFSGVVSFGGAEFSGGEVSFSGARFSGGTVNFGGAEFSGSEVDFRNAEFSGSTVDFTSARFSGGKVDFRSARFSAGDVDFGGAEFSGGLVASAVAGVGDATVDFGEARFSGSGVNFGAAQFSDGEVDFRSARFSAGKVDFSGAGFSGGKVDFGGARFSGSEVDFGARFSGGDVDFGGAEFSGGTVNFGKKVVGIGKKVDGIGKIQLVFNGVFSGGKVNFVDARSPPARSISAMPTSAAASLTSRAHATGHPHPDLPGPVRRPQA